MTCKSRSAVLVIITITCICWIGMSTPGQGQTKKASIDIGTLFTPSGWMGSGEYERKYIEFSGADRTYPHAQPTSFRVSYTLEAKHWGGIYWQNLPDNWGDKPGSDYSGKGFSKIVFWARGAGGGEVVEFKSGGIDATDKGKKFKDSFVVTIGRQTLTKDWRQYTIDLTGQNLKSVIGGFCWVASADYNGAKQITFYLEDIKME